MVKTARLVVAGVIWISGSAAWGQAEKSPVPAESFVLGPAFWATKTMENEPLFFVKDGEGVPTAKLMFHPTGKLTILTPDLTTAYEQGKDYTWQAGANVVELPAGSRIPFKTTAELYPGVNQPNTVNGVLVMKTDGLFWHHLQAQARYEHEEKWTGAVPSAEPEKLKRSIAKLKGRGAFKLVALGDSITNGSGSSGVEGGPPWQPAYAQLAANTLRARFGAPLTFVNLAKGGTRTDWGVTQTDKVIAEKPDLVIIAFGMNDRMKLEEWEANVRKMVESIRAGAPQTDFILVASMLNNPRFRDETRYRGYVDCLRRIEGPGVAVADVFSVWMDVLKRKNYTDLTGNHLNHCNDFGHRIYAQVVLGLYGTTGGETKGK